jgi:septum formation protein
MATLEPRIYLASQSPRRRELLAQIGVRFDLLLFRGEPRSDPETDETPMPGEAPDAYALRVAAAKARHGARLLALRRLPPRPVLAADTTLDVDGEIVGKPVDDTDAAAILERLAGRAHRVLTAVAIAHGEHVEMRLSVSEVRFRALSADEIQRYVLSGEPRDKAGAYGLQGRAAMFVESIEGSPSGIVGLPLCETALLLREFGYPA